MAEIAARLVPLPLAALTCSACGLIRSHSSKKGHAWFQGSSNRRGVDPYFGLPLWLRESVGREFAWAYNAHHLEDLEFFLDGKWKARRHNLALPRHKSTWSYRTRYPQWMHLTANRTALLKAVERMEKRLLRL